jgi:Holliday junction resolvase RusA-like endonuclease
MTAGKWYIIDGVNPEPWAIGPLGVGRRAGGFFPFVGPNKGLQAYQQAIREELSEVDFALIDGPIGLEFYFWRRLTLISTSAKKSYRSNSADATNLQKGLEDALQGTVFANDRVVSDIHSVIVEQGPNVTPRIVMKVFRWNALDPSQLPDFVWREIDKVPSLVSSDNSWGNEEVF